MCGIAGYSSSSIDKSLLKRMSDEIIHRGPDDFGVWADDHVGFAHRRLSIVDLSPLGRQPMLDDQESVVVCFNGEIYNHKELRDELEVEYSYRSSSDTETIIYAYKKWGINFIHKLEGMFAIALYDIKTKELFLVRDRIGIKPLYFSPINGLSFASEIKALWNLPWMNKEINNQAIYHYLTFLSTPAPMTLYKGVYKLPAGFYARYHEQELSFHQWYSPKPKYLNFSEDEYVDYLQDMLKSSIKKRMMSDVPVGVFLSGGVDSSLNVALMSEVSSKVKTFNVVFADGLEHDERAWARKVSNHFGTDHHEIIITEEDAFKFYNRMVYHQDEPLADWVCLPLYYVSKLAKDNGVTVVQCGEGADELFCGYSAYAHYIDTYRYWRPSQRLIPGSIRKAMHFVATGLLSQSKLDHSYNWANDRKFFWGGAIAFKETGKLDYLCDQSFEVDPIINKIYPGMEQKLDSYSIVDYHSYDGDFLSSMTYLELKHRLPELLLMRLDKMAMATSIEGRVPFLDHELVELSLGMPSNFKYKNGVTKYILKRAAEKFLPHDIIYRTKVGFSAPVNKWFRSGKYFKPYLHHLINSQSTLNKDRLNDLVLNHQSMDLAPLLWTVSNLLSAL